MYLEFLFVLVFYYTTLSWRDVLFEIVIPILISVLFYFFGQDTGQSVLIADSINFSRILLGFSMASLALFLTKNGNLGETKDYMTKRKLMGKPVSLYKYVVLSFTYLIIVLCLLQVAYFLCSMFGYYLDSMTVSLMKAAYVFILFHIVLATIRAITETYQVLSRHC